MTPEEIIEQLNSICLAQDFVSRSANLIDGWTSTGAGVETVGPILQFMEEHPAIDLGAPGPLVHFIEGFCQKGYEERLVDSVQRKPTSATVWLLNRIINGEMAPHARQKFIELMSGVLSNRSANDAARELAGRFLHRLNR